MACSERFNIVYSGHYDYEALRDNLEMLRAVLEDCGLNVDISETLDPDKKNLIYEGHHPNFWDDILALVENNGPKNLYLVCTEEIVGSRFLPKKYFTFNNFDLASASKWKKILHPARLLFLNFRFWCAKKSEGEKGVLSYLTKRFKLKQPDRMWKERYDFFLRLSSKCHGHITTYDEAYADFGFENSFYLPHLFTKKDLKKTAPSFSNVEYDCIFTGAMTPHRNQIIEHLRNAGLKVCAPGIIEDKERWKLINNSHIILGLLKYPNQYTSSTNRTFLALKNNKLIINELPKKNDYLDEFVITSSTENFVPNTLMVVTDIKMAHVKFQKLRKIAVKKFNSKNYETEILSYFGLH